MRSESAREAAATFLLGLVLAVAVISVGQVGLPPGMLPLAPPGVWDSYEALRVPFDFSEATSDARREDASPTRDVVETAQPAAADGGPALAPAARRWSARANARPMAGDDRSSNGPDVSRRDKPATQRRPDRVSSGAPKDRRGAAGARGKDGGSSATRGSEHRKAYGSLDRALAQRPIKAVAAAAQHGRPSVDAKRGPARSKGKSRAAKAWSKRSHTSHHPRGRSA